MSRTDSFSDQLPRPAVAVDCVAFGLTDDELRVLLVRREQNPFAGCWTLPGRFVALDEPLEVGARRELDERGIHIGYLEQLYTFGELDRDPRGRLITIVYLALVKLANPTSETTGDPPAAGWFSVRRVPKLAFDHQQILDMALQRMRTKVRYQPIGFELLPREFTLRQLQQLYEKLLQRNLDKRNFRKRVLSMDLLTELDKVERGVSHRAARLYRFNKRRYNQLVRQGFNFEL